MFHATNARLGRQARRIRDLGVARDNAIATGHGWHAQQIKPGTWSYRDPRFSYLSFARTQPSTGCTWCDDKIAERLYYLGPDHTVKSRRRS
jgi:hypothetical protein